jgi:hypothetical protein
MLRIIVFATALTFTSWAHADSPWFWEIQSTDIQLIEETTSANMAVNYDCVSLTGNPLTGDVSWDDIVNIGKKAWEIIEAGKPVSHIETPTANALPRGIQCWNNLEHWQAPKVQTYQVVYKNGFGMEVVRFNFRLQYTYGGGKAEKGQYLANVTILPSELNVSWGYNFDARVEVQPAVNVGTQENPIAGLELNLRWTVKTVLKTSENSFHFFVQGDGVSQSVN